MSGAVERLIDGRIFCRQVQEYFENTYDLDEHLFSAVAGACAVVITKIWVTVFSKSADEKYLYKCPDRLRLPLIFYLAHPATLYVNKLLLASLISVSILQ